MSEIFCTFQKITFCLEVMCLDALRQVNSRTILLSNLQQIQQTKCVIIPCCYQNNLDTFFMKMLDQ